MRTTRRVTIVLCLVVAGAAAATYAFQSRGARQGPAREPVTPVAVATATSTDFPITINAVGTVQASNKVDIHSQITGTIQRLAFTEGQTVRAGDLLAEIDARPYQAALGQAEAALARDQATLGNARRDLERYSSLAQSGFATSQQLDTQRATIAQGEANVKGDQAAIDKARSDLSYTKITAPIDGVTGLRSIDTGNVIHPTDVNPLVSITQIHPIAVVFTLPSDALVQIQEQMRKGTLSAEARDQADKVSLATGDLAVVDNQVDSKTGTVRLKALFANTDSTLWPGAFVNLRLTVDKRHGTTVPAVALQHGAEGVFVYVVAPGDNSAPSAVEVRPVKVIAQQGDLMLLDDSLQPGENVVTDGQARLTQGAKVRVANGAPQGDQPAKGANPANRRARAK